jgi:predicted ArsR family transcriptional regulator
VNTLRKHLEALEKRGLVERTQAPPRGRGRPARLFRATDPERRSEYAGLATALAAAIYRTSPTPRADAIAAGAAWGRELAEEKGPPRRSGGPAARRQVIALLDDLGFAPEPDRRHSTARLTRCPLLDAAHRYPEVVCGVHLGITRGALDAYGVSSSAAGLHPFSEPGACRLELREEQP